MSLLEKLNSPLVVVLVLAVFLILDGFLFYRYQQSLESMQNAATSTPVEEIAEDTTTFAEDTTPLVEGVAREMTVSPEDTNPPVEGVAREMTSSPEERNGVQVAVSVVRAPVGLSVQEDGRLVHDQVTNPGFFEEFEAEESITITAADGGAVEVGVDGEEPTLLGEGGEGVTRTFTDE
jgi:hypothetical protein